MVFNPYSSSFLKRLTQARLRPADETLFRALGGPGTGKTVFDLFGGWRKEALLMSSWGYRVLSTEIHLEVHRTFENHAALFRPDEVSRIEALNKDGMSLRKENVTPFDVLYLDPMFSAEGKKSALPKKDMQVLRDWTQGQPEYWEEITALCRDKTIPRRVLKWPSRNFHLALKPSTLLEGAGFRYYIFVN